MYRLVDQPTCKMLRIKCEEILKAVQKELASYFTFQFLLIGSGERKLVTQNDNGVFDLDYNLVIMRDKKGIINDPKAIKDLFLQAFNKTNPNLGFTFPENSTSAITSKLKLNNEIHFSFDCAIMCEGNNGNMYKIVFDKPDRYIWNEIKNTKDFNAKYKYLKSQGEFENIKKLYLAKKNDYHNRRIQRTSFAVLSETVNEIMQNYR